MNKIFILFFAGIISVTTAAAFAAKSEGYALDVEKRPDYSFEVYHDIIITEKSKEAEKPVYEVNGLVLDVRIQEKLYDELDKRGIAHWYPYAMCQIYQESRFNETADNGEDYGLCQFRRRWWEDHVRLAGLEGKDIYSTDDQIEVYAGVIAYYLRDSQIAEVYKRYYDSGDPEKDEQYVQEVTQWYDKTRRIK